MANEKKVITLDNLADFKQRYDQTVEDKLAGKQDNLIAGDHITIENNVISATYKAPSVMAFKGTVQTYADLPATGNTTGDVWNVAENGENYVWTGTEWDKFSSDVDLSNYVTTNTAQTISAPKTIRTNQSNNGVSLSTGSINTLTITGLNSGSASIELKSGNTGDAKLSASSTNQLVFNKGAGNIGGISSSFSFPDGRIGETIATTADIPNNIEEGTGTNSIQQKTPDASIDFTGRNPNAEALDPTLSATINTGASGNQATAIGKDTIALGINSFTNGNKTIAKGDESHAEGYQSVALGDGSHAEGNETVAYGDSSHAEGFVTQAIGDNSHAEGSTTSALAGLSHAEGYNTTVKDNYLIVDSGVTPTPTPTPTPEPSTPAEKDALNGVGAHAEGHNTFALGIGSHAEGDSTKAYGRLSHAEGGSTEAGEIIIRKSENGKDYYTPNQDKQFQHAEGESTKAIGHASHAEGFHAIANQDYQHVSGKYNNNKTNTLFEVGNGTSDSARSNAFEVYEDGHAEVGLMGSANLSVATKQYVDAVRAIAEGKCKTYILSYAQTTPAQTVGFYEMDGTYHEYSELASYISGYVNGNGLFNSQSAAFTISGTTGVIQKTYYILKRADLNLGTSPVIALSDTMSAYLKTGDIFLVVETDVPDRWFGYTAAGVAYKLETSKIDLSGYVTTNTNQEVSSAKTYRGNNLLRVSNTGWTTKWAFNFDSSANLVLNYLTNNDSSTTHYVFGRTTGFYPATNGGKDLGTSTYLWKDLYLSGGSIYKDGSGTSTRIWKAQATNWGTLDFYTSNDGGTTWGNRLSVQNAGLLPTSANMNLGLGNGSQRWGSVSTAKLTDGVNETTVANINSNFAPAYDATATYSVGDYVTYAGRLYVCSTAVSQAESFDSDKWTATDVTSISPSTSNLVTLDTAQRITAPKAFFNNTANNTLPLRIQGFENKTWGIEMDKDFGRLHFKFANVAGTNISNVITHYTWDSSAFFPATNNTKDLGTSSNTWKDLYLGGTAYITNLDNDSGTFIFNGNVRPKTGGNRSLGNSTYKWKDLHLSGSICLSDSTNTYNWTQENDGGDGINISRNGTVMYSYGASNFRPGSSNARDLGNIDKKWKDLYLSGNLSDGTNSVTVAALADLISGGGGNVSDLYLEINDEPTQAQLEQVYTQKPDVLRIGMGGSEHVVVLYKSVQSEEDTRLNYFNIQTSEGVIQVLKIEYSEGDGYVAEPYEWTLDSIVSGTNDGTNWTSLTINGDTYDIPNGGGTNVVANPTLAGTESDLIGLEVAGTKYRVPQFEIQSNLKGKKISLIGDSITTYSGYLPSGNATRYPRGAITNVNQTWWKQLIDQTGMVLGQNCAWDGSTCIGRSTSTTNAYGACSAKRISQLGLNGDPDIIICFIGINDWGATYNNTGTHYGSPFTNGAFVPVGSYTGETAAPSGDLQTFSEAYGSMIYNIQVKYPNAKIYCCTLLQTNGKATYNYDADGAFPSINRNGVTLAAYNECIRTLAKNIGAEVIEFAKCGINWGNMSTFLEDGLHPNVAGMKLLCASAKAKLEADFGYTTESFTPLQTFSVTNNLTNVTNSNNATTASESTTYSASLIADTGYTISSVTITMGGTDITSSAYSGGVISIGNVTGNIVITASATLNVYSITNSLTNVTNSNQAASINHGNSYSATLTMPSGYHMQSVSIQMGGVDITSSAYSDNNISISSVTGNIIITAVATNQVTYSITNNLSNVTNSNASVSIIQGNSYSATLTPSTHYELQTANVSILMGGTDVTGTAYDGSNRTISIPNVTGALVINATATIITHTITNTLTHTTNSNNAVSANDGSSYSGTLTADTGYNISSVSVTMGGVDITSTAYSNGVITISSVTGDVVIQCVSTAVVYSITNNLTNATSDNAASTINYGSSYNATITADSGYAIATASVTMGGVDITNTAYDNGVISISSVTGDLVITITALDPTAITWYTNFSQTSTNSFVASSRGWALDETTYANIYNKPINRISLVATASSGSIDICVAPRYNAQSGFTQQQTINWTSANKVGNIVTLELSTPITLATGEYLCVYVNSTPATGVACYASGGSAGQFYSYVGSSGHGTWGSKGSYSIQMNIGYKAN